MLDEEFAVSALLAWPIACVRPAASTGATEFLAYRRKADVHNGVVHAHHEHAHAAQDIQSTLADAGTRFDLEEERLRPDYLFTHFFAVHLGFSLMPEAFLLRQRRRNASR